MRSQKVAVIGVVLLLSTVFLVGVSAGQEEWSYSTVGDVESSPAVADGNVYFNSEDGNLYSADADTGAENWRRSVGTSLEGVSPVVSDGTVYLGTDDGMYALNTGDGGVVWKDSSYRVTTSPTVSGGRVYFGNDTKVHALSASDGSEQWTFDTNKSGFFFSKPAVSGGSVYIGFFNAFSITESKLYSLNADTGSKEGEPIDNAAPLVSSPTVDSGSIYVGSNDGNLYSVDANTGSNRWRFSTSQEVQTSPLVDGDTVYAGSRNGNLYAVDASDGNERWSFGTGAAIGQSSPVAASGTVYVGSEDGNLYAVEQSSGNEEWRFSTDGSITGSSPAVNNGMVYVGSTDNKLYAVNASGPSDGGNDGGDDEEGGDDGGSNDSPVQASIEGTTVSPGTVDVETRVEVPGELTTRDTLLVLLKHTEGTLVESYDDLPLEPGYNKLFESTFSNLDDGSYTVEAKLQDLQREYDAASDEESVTVGGGNPSGGGLDSSISVADDTITAGEETTAEVQIENTGDGSVTVDTQVVLFRTEQDSETLDEKLGLEIGPGEVETYTVNVPTSTGDEEFSPLSVSLRVDGEEVASTQFDVTEPEGPEILSVSQSPDAPETDEDVEVRVTVDEPEDEPGSEFKSGVLEYTVDAETFEKSLSESEFDPPGVGYASAIISDTRHGIGSEIKYNVTVRNEQGGETTSKDYLYYSFHEVNEVAVIYGKYKNSPRETGPALEGTQRELVTDINKFYASGNGSMGAIGFKFTFFDNYNNWYNVDSIGTGPNDIRRKAFLNDLQSTAGVNEINYDIIIGVDSDTGDINPPTTYGDSPSSRIYITETTPYTTYLHELGHTQGAQDFYPSSTNGQATIKHLGLMGTGNNERPPVRFSAPGRTKFAELNYPWLGTNERNDRGGTEYPIEALSAKEYRRNNKDEVFVFDTRADPTLPIIGKTADIKYILEARGIERSVSIEGISFNKTLDKGVYIYKHTEPIINPTSPSTVQYVNRSYDNDYTVPTLVDGAEAFTSHDPDSFVEFKLTSESGDGEEYVAHVEATEPSGVSSQSVGTTTTTIVTDRGSSGAQGVQDPNATTPQTVLEAVDEEGNVVRAYGDTNEIPGTVRSGPGSHQWVSVPQNRSVTYRINTSGVEEWIEEENINESGINITADFSLTEYHEDPTLVEENGIERIENATIQRTFNKTIEPGEELALGSRGEVNFEPDTLNKASAGSWVNVTFRTPEDGVDVEEISLSTVRLDEEVEPVTNERYGFVRNPVENGTLKMKFPRDEVSESLETGEEVRVVVSGETTGGDLVVGSDYVDVIENGSSAPRECSSGRGPPSETPGQGPLNEIPGKGPGDGPGERVGPPDETPGRGPPDELPGRGLADCQEDEEGEDSDGNEDVGEDETSDDGLVDDRRNAGRGESTPRDDRGGMGRGVSSDDEWRGGSDRRRTRGR